MNSANYHQFVSVTVQALVVASFFSGCAQSPQQDTQGSEVGTLVERKYVISDIIRSYDSPKSLPERVDELIVCVTANIEPGNWNTVEFSVSADHASESILAKCNSATHDRIHALLEDIRKLKKQSKQYPPLNVPRDAGEIDPWISTLLNVDVPNARDIVAKRLRTDNAQLAPLVERMGEFIPYQVVFSAKLGHVKCVRQYVDAKSNKTQYDAIYLAQALSQDKIQKRIEFFDESLRSTMSEFLLRFAGSGEEVADSAGQFAYDHWPTAEEFGNSEEGSLGDWKDATLLYHSMNGDAVFIKPNGATAWRVLETDETIPLATTFAEFIELYAAFRGTYEPFDSWAYRDFKQGRARQ